MELGELVTGAPFVCGPDTTLAEVASALAERGHGSAGVVEGRTLLGVVTERDLVRAVGTGVDLDSVTVRRYMSADPDVFAPDTDVFEAAVWITQSGYRHLPVVEAGRLLGIVSLRGLLEAILGELDEEE